MVVPKRALQIEALGELAAERDVIARRKKAGCTAAGFNDVKLIRGE
jgi:hypothetical protein